MSLREAYHTNLAAARHNPANNEPHAGLSIFDAPEQEPQAALPYQYLGDGPLHDQHSYPAAEAAPVTALTEPTVALETLPASEQTPGRARRAWEKVANTFDAAFDKPGYLLGVLDAKVRTSKTVERISDKVAQVTGNLIGEGAKNSVPATALIGGALVVGRLVKTTLEMKGVLAPSSNGGNVMSSAMDYLNTGDSPAEAAHATVLQAPELHADTAAVVVPEAPDTIKEVAQHDTVATGRDVTAAVAPSPDGAQEPVMTIKAESGEGSIKVSERIIEQQAAALGSDIKADDLTDKQFAVVQDAFTDDAGNKGDFYDDGKMNLGTVYETDDATAAAAKLIHQLDPEAAYTGGDTTTPGQVTPPVGGAEAPVDETPAAEAPATTEPSAAPSGEAVVVPEVEAPTTDADSQNFAEEWYGYAKDGIHQLNEDAHPIRATWNEGYDTVNDFAEKYGDNAMYALGGLALAVGIGSASHLTHRIVSDWRYSKTPEGQAEQAALEDAIKNGTPIIQSTPKSRRKARRQARRERSNSTANDTSGSYLGFKGYSADDVRTVIQQGGVTRNADTLNTDKAFGDMPTSSITVVESDRMKANVQYRLDVARRRAADARASINAGVNSIDGSQDSDVDVDLGPAASGVAITPKQRTAPLDDGIDLKLAS